MMKLKYLIVGIAAIAFTFTSCSKGSDNPVNPDPENPDNPTVTVYVGTAEFCVPAGTKKVTIHYNSKAGEAKTIDVPVSPKVATPTNGRDPEPFGTVKLSFQADTPTSVSISNTSNSKGERVYCVENFPVTTKKSMTASTKADTPIKLSEPAAYTTTDGGKTFYHSSGVVMFEDSWPNCKRLGGSGAYDSDFNDCVIDYDIEAVVVPDNLLESEGWREQVKVALHLRVVGGSDPARVGLILENFNQAYVESIEEHKTLDSYNNPHGTLPAWTQVTLQENSLHYDPLNTTYASNNPLRPCIEMGAIFRMNDAGRGAGTETYTYTNNGVSNTTVFNPHLNDYWAAPKTEQYSAELNSLTTPFTLAHIQSARYYNSIPGYVNVAGGLYTYTVIYHMKPRAKMSASESAAAKKNMIDAVVKTENQNFYLINKSWIPVHLKGYTPGDFAVKGHNNYVDKYNEVFAANADKLDPTIPYASKEGFVWAIKCPTLTRHLWNKMYFSYAYPRYENWLDSGGKEDQDWYTNYVDKYLSCWW